jgi:GR25 family glycosyltransferase involved in LPS biosynthesis
MPTKKIVERCFLMNLDRRDDRLHEWMQQLPQPWPFPDVERFAAIDGRRLATPEQWRAGNGAWGCYRSHLLILEKCLLEGIDSYVVFEDDAGFVPDFVEHLNAYVRELPEDWGLAWIPMILF